jgi:CRISPR-associated endonuclease/helicase Cas3
MSATATRKLLTSREWRDGEGDKRPEEFVFELPDADRADTNGTLGRRRLATKRLEHQTSWTLQDSQATERILKRHEEMLRQLSGAPAEVPRRTLVICNTVQRARAIHSAIANFLAVQPNDMPVLLHSRFRPTDRVHQQERLKGKPDPAVGQIVISTQVIEAGVDLSAAILWTDRVYRAAAWPLEPCRRIWTRRRKQIRMDSSRDCHWRSPPCATSRSYEKGT